MKHARKVPDTDVWQLLRYQRRSDVTVTDLGNQLVLLDPENQEVYALDEVGRFIWERLPDGTLGAIAEALCQRYGIEPSTAQRDLGDLVNELCDAGLIRAQYDDEPAT